MIVENPAALRFILNEDLYLLDKDKFAAPVSMPIEPSIPAAPILQETAAPVSAPAAPVAPLPQETVAPAFKYMGGNKKNFLITVHYTDNEFIDDTHLTALENILKRKELYIDDVAILNLNDHSDHTLEEITAHFKPQKLLLMGQKAIPQNMQVPALNQPTQLTNCMALYSFSFDEMMSSNDNKKAFWDQMKLL